MSTHGDDQAGRQAPWRIVLFDDSDAAAEEFGKLCSEADTPVELRRFPDPNIDASVEEVLVAFRPHLFVVDLLLGSSQNDGMKVIRRLQQIPSLEKVPIVVCSKFINNSDVGKAMQRECLDMPGVVAAYGKIPSYPDIWELLVHAKCKDEI